MNGLRRLLLGLAVVLASSPLSASPMLVFQPTATTLDLGDTINVDVIATGLDGRYVAAYDVTVGWDDSVLSLRDIAFDRFLGGPETLFPAVCWIPLPRASLKSHSGHGRAWMKMA